MNKTLWEHIKSLKPKVVEVIQPTTVQHPGPKVAKAKSRRGGKGKGKSLMTNHERVQLRRASKAGITLKEYRAKYCGEVAQIGQNYRNYQGLEKVERKFDLEPLTA